MVKIGCETSGIKTKAKVFKSKIKLSNFELKLIRRPGGLGGGSV